jgi:hypothetical protein
MEEIKMGNGKPVVFQNGINFYRANKSGTGSACQMSMFFRTQKEREGVESLDGCIFIEMAKQLSGEKKFDWDKKLMVAFGINDIVFIWDFILSKDVERKTMHKYNNNITNIGLKRMEDGAIYLSLNKKVGENNVNIGIPISKGEMRLLDTFFHVFLEKYYA